MAALVRAMLDSALGQIRRGAAPDRLRTELVATVDAATRA
jgi:hypothetical protein